MKIVLFLTESLGMVEKKKSLGNGEPLLHLQSRRLSCDASRKGSAWTSSVTDDVKLKEETLKKDHPCPWRRNHREKKISMKRSSRNKKVIHIVSTKKAQFSHILPGDSCVHNSPIIYQPKRCEQSRREVATLWYHPFQAGN